MLYVWLVRQYRFKCDLWKFGEICMIHRSQRLREPRIALDQNRPQTLSGEARACKRDDWGNATGVTSVIIIAWRFAAAVFKGKQHISPSFARRQSSFGMKKPMYIHCANFQLALLRLWQNRGPQPGHQNMPVEQSQNILHQRGSLFENGPVWTFTNQPYALSTPADILGLDSALLANFSKGLRRRDSDVVLTNFFCCFQLF